MPQSVYGISDARKNLAEVLARANKGEEITIVRGGEIYARIGPPTDGGKRPFGSLRHLGLPDDLFDAEDPTQTAIDAGEWTDEVGIWRGGPGDDSKPA